MPRKAPSAASGRRTGSDGALRLTPPGEHHHGAHHRLGGAEHRDVGPAGFAARGTLRALSTAIGRTSVALAGTVRPHRHDAPVGRRLVGIDAREAARHRERRHRRSRRGDGRGPGAVSGMRIAEAQSAAPA